MTIRRKEDAKEGPTGPIDIPTGGKVLPLRRIARDELSRSKSRTDRPVVGDGDDDDPDPTAA
jgi:hypothetical protein